MQITKIHVVGSDFLVCEDAFPEGSALALRLLDRRRGIGADALVLVGDIKDGVSAVRVFLPDGREAFTDTVALFAAAKYFYDRDGSIRQATLRIGDVACTVHTSVLGSRALCSWLELPRIKPRPMEQLKYYHGIRGEVLRACIERPRVCLYSLCGEHAVFLLDSAAAVRRLALRDVCTRLCEVLFYGEKIDLHFAGLSGESMLEMRSFRCGGGELYSSCEGAALSAYAAHESELVERSRVIVKSHGGSLCVELDGMDAQVCAKSETVFFGEAM